MHTDKISFLKQEFLPLLQQLPFDAAPVWGTMTVHQMIEHLAGASRLSSGRFVGNKVLTAEEKLPAMQAFLMSDLPFPKGVVNPFLNEAIPAPLKTKSIEEAVKELKSEMDYFFRIVESDDKFEMLHPYFGRLNTEMNVQQLYKHVVHHLTQFGVDVQSR